MTLSRANRARLALCGAIAWSCAFAPRAVADEALQLRWQAPSECPSREWVSSRVQRHLDAGVELEASADLQVEVEVRQEAGVMRAHASIRSPYGEHERSFSDQSCVVVADVAAFVIAQAFDPQVRADKAPLTDADIAEAERSSPRGRADMNDGASAPATQPGTQLGTGDPGAGSGSSSGDGPGKEARDAQAPAQDATPDASEGDQDERDELPAPPSAPLLIDWATSLQAELNYGPLPELGPAGVLRVSMLLGRVVRIELAASYQLPQTRALPSDPGVEARFDQIGGLLALCATFGSADSELGACLQALAAAQRGRGADLSAGTNDSAPYLALRVAPVLLQRITGTLWGRFELGPSLPLVWPRFIVDEAGARTVLHEPKRLGFFAALGAEWRFD